MPGIDPLSAVTAGVGLVEGVANLIDKGKIRKRTQALLNQRQAYQTPQEVYDVLNATQQNASFGLDPAILNYLTNQSNAAFAGTLGAVQRLGGDPNAMSLIFGQKMDALGKIVAMDAGEQMKKFGDFLEAKNTVAANKAAEQKSEQDILKDKIQAEGVNLSTANQNINNGLNTVLGALSSNQMMNLYKQKGAGVTDNQIGILPGLQSVEPVSPYDPAMVNSTGFIN